MHSHTTTHGQSRTRIYKIWMSMKARCFNQTDKNFACYGGRGIRVDAGWRVFETFRDWAISSGYRENLTIERDDVNGHYEPSNCRWIPMIEQSGNRRCVVYLEAFGERKTIKKWSQDIRCQVSAGALYARIRTGMDHEKAITTPHRTMIESLHCDEANQWAAMASVPIEPKTIRYRIKNGWTLEKAISIPRFQPHEGLLVEAFGEIKLASEWSRDPRCHCDVRTIIRRVSQGWNSEEAISTPTRPMQAPNPIVLSAFGETKTLIEWTSDKRCKSLYSTIRFRINQGWNAEQAISTPSPSKRSETKLD